MAIETFFLSITQIASVEDSRVSLCSALATWDCTSAGPICEDFHAQNFLVWGPIKGIALQ